MITFYRDELEKLFSTVRIEKQTVDKSVTIVRHKESGQFFVMRTFHGDPASYQKLIGVKSPYLPQVLEVLTENDETLVIEEYVSGDLVCDMLTDVCFNEKETASIAMDICKALYTLHTLGLVHRDVKPENIILHADHAVLIDLDAAREVKWEKSTDTVALGTSGYAAPEQYGISQTDGRADIYALGVTMNLMLTGTHPSVRLAGGRFGRIISRCTMVQPDKRYSDIRKLMEVLPG